MQTSNLALKVDPRDNVATIFAQEITDGAQVEVRDPSGQRQTFSVIGTVPY